MRVYAKFNFGAAALALSLFLSLDCSILALATFLHLISFCAKGVARPRPVQRFVAFCFCFACTQTQTQTHVRTHTQTLSLTYAHAQQRQHNVHDYFAALLLFVMFLFANSQQLFFLRIPFCALAINSYVHTHTRAEKKYLLKCIPISAFS